MAPTTETKRKAWTLDSIPPLNGKTVIVTGANSGLGFHTAKTLAAKGACTLLACRNQSKAEKAKEKIQQEHPEATLELLPLDLADLGSVREFAAAFTESHEKLDILINNAGVMAIPRQTTKDGFETQFGVNHLGHFALTGRLIEPILRSAPSRIVSLSSGMHYTGKMDFADLQSEKRYGKWKAYGQSKLANLLFALELQRRLEEHHPDVISLSCHPGYADTNLQKVGPEMAGSSLAQRSWGFVNKVVAQDAAIGAHPTLYAATGNVKGGEYYGPGGIGGQRGTPPKKARPSARARNKKTAAELWEVSCELTGVGYEALSHPLP